MPGACRRGAEDEDVHVGLEEEVRAEPPECVGAERVEGDVAEVEQTGEAHDDVQTEREHHVRQGHDLRVDEVAGRREEAAAAPGRTRSATPPGARGHHGRQPALDRRSPFLQLCAQLVHPASRVSSPSSPRGRRTRMMISRPNTTERCPLGADAGVDVCWMQPMISPPMHGALDVADSSHHRCRERDQPRLEPLEVPDRRLVERVHEAGGAGQRAADAGTSARSCCRR